MWLCTVGPVDEIDVREEVLSLIRRHHQVLLKGQVLSSGLIQQMLDAFPECTPLLQVHWQSQLGHSWNPNADVCSVLYICCVTPTYFWGCHFICQILLWLIFFFFLQLVLYIFTLCIEFLIGAALFFPFFFIIILICNQAVTIEKSSWCQPVLSLKLFYEIGCINFFFANLILL